jgi:hypothetical protein
MRVERSSRCEACRERRSSAPCAQRRERGEVAPKAIAARPPKQSGALSAELEAQLRAQDAVSLAAPCRLWEHSHGVKVSPSTMSRAIKRLGWTRKKRRLSCQRPSGRRASARFASRCAQGDASRLLVVDEWGSTIALTPLDARAPKGQRAQGSVPPESSAQIRPCWLPGHSPASERACSARERSMPGLLQPTSNRFWLPAWFLDSSWCWII